MCSFFATLFRDHDSGRVWFQRLLGIQPSFTVVAVFMSLTCLAWIVWAVVAIPLTRPFETVIPGAQPVLTPREVWRARLRLIARMSQFLWPVAALLLLWAAKQDDNQINGKAVSDLLGMGPETVTTIAEILRTVAFCGMGMLAWNLSRLAFLANDTALAWKFNAAAFAFVGAWPGIIVCGLLAGATENVFFMMVGVVLWILLLLGLGAFGLGLFQLPQLALAAIGSQQAAIERDRRAIEKANKERDAAKKGEKSPFDSRRTISKPTPCLSCGGELHGMTYGQKCPQCGHRIGEV